MAELLYHSQTDIEELFRQAKVSFTATSTVTETDLNNHMLSTEVYVTERLRPVYRVPVTDETAKSILKRICARLTAATVWRILNAVTQPGESNKAKEWQNEAETTLDRIISGEMAFGGATPAGAGKPTSGTKDSEPIWKLKEDQW